MDSGLLGEHLLQTLLHAWDQLLRPACPNLKTALESETPLAAHGVVIPFGAKLWAAPIQCRSIARRNYVLDEDSTFNFKNNWLFSDLREPYDTENLTNTKDCKFLSDPVEVFTFDFNNPSQLRDYYDGVKDGTCVSFSYEGKSDALAVWFDVLLDEDITISSSPFSSDKQCCWDQAIFRFKKPQEKSVKVRTNCGGGRLSFGVIQEPPVSLSSSDENLAHLRSTLSSTRITSEIAVSTEMICFINNKELQNVFDILPEHFDCVNKNVLDLSPFPVFGLRILELGGVNLFCVLKTVEEVTAVKEFVKSNNLNLAKVKCLVKDELEDLLSNSCEKFDFIINHLFEPTGELKEENINIIPRLMKALLPGGVLGPVSLSVMCQLVDCEWISHTSRVINEELTQTYRIAEFINLYQVSQQLDVDLRNVSYSPLSEVTACLQLNNTDLASDSCRIEDFTITVSRDGCISAVPVWYECQLCDGVQRISTFSDNSHVNQVVFVVDPPVNVKSGESVSVNVVYHCGILRLKIVS